jgi:hypothetical protein
LILTFGRVEAQDFAGLPRDKVTHGAASFSAQVLCASVASELLSKRTANLTCLVAVNALGVAIESDILGENTFELEDIRANLIGSGIGAIAVEWKF